MAGVMAEFKVREYRTGNTSKTQLLIHGKVVASSKSHDVYTNKMYERIFDGIKTKLR